MLCILTSFGFLRTPVCWLKYFFFCHFHFFCWFQMFFSDFSSTARKTSEKILLWQVLFIYWKLPFKQLKSTNKVENGTKVFQVPKSWLKYTTVQFTRKNLEDCFKMSAVGNTMSGKGPHLPKVTIIPIQVYSLFQLSVEQVYYFLRWVVGAKSLRCQDFADRQTYRTGAPRCMKWARNTYSIHNPTSQAAS